MKVGFVMTLGRTCNVLDVFPCFRSVLYLTAFAAGYTFVRAVTCFPARACLSLFASFACLFMPSFPRLPLFTIFLHACAGFFSHCPCSFSST